MDPWPRKKVHLPSIACYPYNFTLRGNGHSFSKQGDLFGYGPQHVQSGLKSRKRGIWGPDAGKGNLESCQPEGVDGDLEREDQKWRREQGFSWRGDTWHL